MISLRPADSTDIGFIETFDLVRVVVPLAETVGEGRVRTAMDGTEPFGFLWFSVLWGTLPFVEFVEILAPKRGQALEAAAVRAWER